jgi:hypothetical protein
VGVPATQAVLRLKAECRWAVTGTPVQNRVRDLLSMMMFLRLEPLQDRTWWQRCMERPLKQREELGLKRLQVGGQEGEGSAAMRSVCCCTGTAVRAQQGPAWCFACRFCTVYQHPVAAVWAPVLTCVSPSCCLGVLCLAAPATPLLLQVLMEC